jgi:hypothetical protein
MHYFRLTPSSDVLKRTGGLFQAYSSVANTFPRVLPRAAVIRDGGELEIVSPSPIDVEEIYTEESLDRGKIKIVESRSQAPLDLSKPSQYHAFLRLFYMSQRDSLEEQGYHSRGRVIFKPLEEITPKIPTSKNEFVRKIQSYIHLHPGIDIRFKLIEGSPYLQVQPKSVLEFNKDIFSLLQERVLSKEEVTRRFENVRLPIDRLARLLGIVSKKASDSIKEPPFDGKSFLEYAGNNYSTIRLAEREAPLLIALPAMGSSPWYFTSEQVVPSLSFLDLAHYDAQIAGILTSAMKIYSATRRDILETSKRSLRLRFFGQEVGLEPSFSKEGVDDDIQVHDLLTSDLTKPFIHFPRPLMQFRDAGGSPVQIGHFPDLGAPGDLLRRRDLRPFDVPGLKERIRIKIICDFSLEEDTKILLEKLQSGLDGYPDFEQIFQTPLEVVKISTVKSFEEPGAYSDISPSKYDCVLVVGPRTFTADPVQTRKIYSTAETSILRQGVNPQFISDNPSQNPNYDASLKSKAERPNVLFGIGLQILGKIGARVLELSGTSSDVFVPNSVVLAYNIARVFEQTTDNLASADSPRDFLKTSSALSAPVVVMTDHGTEIIQQSAHEISSESSLFSSDHGRRVLAEIPSRYTTIVIHKDGPFHDRELQDIKGVLAPDRIIIPISITTSNVPRFITTNAKLHFLSKAGLLLQLSPRDFLMSTSLVTQSYDPRERGWPQPIWIHIHDEILSKELTNRDRLRLAYQIWAFTRLHLGSENPIRRPISIHYSNQMNQFLRKAGESEPTYFQRFSERNRFGYVSRPFM